MPIANQVIVEVLNVVERSIRVNDAFVRRSPQATQSLSSDPTVTRSTPAATTTQSTNNGPTSSPLLFFVALGFGVVFTNLWIIVGVKYCFRYNARNRAMRAGEEGEITLENMPTRPHRRRREKKLMTMDEVNERFPLTKYKAWVASRARDGLPTSGGVTAPSSRAGSLRHIDLTSMPSSPVDTKLSDERPRTPATENERKSIEVNNMSEKPHEPHPASVEDSGLDALKEVATTTSTVGNVNNDASDDEDDHIHTAVLPEMLANPGDSCAICIDTLEDDDDIRGLTCGHAFHAGCLDPWLTSRRACCPLCKADYYVPKPRPERIAEQEAADAERRRSARANVPQPPQSAWSGIRGSPRLMLPGRILNSSGAREVVDARGTRRPPGQTDISMAENNASAQGNGASRWRIGNPFSGVSMPTVRIPGRRQAGTDDTTTTTTTTPSQLEANTR